MIRMQAIHDEVIVGNEAFKKGATFFCSSDDAMELDARGAAKAAPLPKNLLDLPEAIPAESKGKK